MSITINTEMVIIRTGGCGDDQPPTVDIDGVLDSEHPQDEAAHAEALEAERSDWGEAEGDD